jgi:dolichol-phosphate mannosyltransferase
MNENSSAKRAPLGLRTLIITPTYNERYNLPLFIKATLEVAPAANILVVDDASPDGTGEIADELAAGDPRVQVLHRTGKLGLGSAYIEAFERGLMHDYEYFFEMDADLSHDPSYLPRFILAFEEGADVVIGSRNVVGGGVQGWGMRRQVLSKGGSWYSRKVLGVKVRDLTTGYKAFSRKALERIDLRSVHSNGYSFQIEMTYRALQAGLRVVEVPIMFVDRQAGDSKMNSRIVAEAVTMVWKLRFADLEKR